jgi:hypothetical protein
MSRKTKHPPGILKIILRERERENAKKLSDWGDSDVSWGHLNVQTK